MAMELSETEEKAFRMFGIILIVLSLIFFLYALMGSDVYKADTIILDGGESVTKGLNFNKGETVNVEYDILEGSDDIYLLVETEAVYGGKRVNLTQVEDNTYRFTTNETQQYYISFINAGDDEMKIHYEISLEGYNNHEDYLCISISILILGIIIVVAFFRNLGDKGRI